MLIAVTVFRRSLQYLTFLCSSSYSFKLLLAFMFVCSFILLSVRHCWVLCWQIVYGSCTCCPRVCTQEVLYGGKISGASSATSACPWPSSTQVSVLIQPCATLSLNFCVFYCSETEKLYTLFGYGKFFSLCLLALPMEFIIIPLIFSSLILYKIVAAWMRILLTFFHYVFGC
jgi:hypothetical protein